MKSLKSPLDIEGLVDIIHDNYDLNIRHIDLYREMIGYVYIVESTEKKYVLKIYRPFNKSHALQSIEIIQYLHLYDYPAVTMVRTKHEDFYFSAHIPEGQCIGVLFDYIDGVTPDIEAEVSNIGRQVGVLHNIMENYPNNMVSHGKEFFIDRYIEILRTLDYDPARVAELDRYGQKLWDSMKRLPKGFCHGDIHTGNMFMTGPERYVLFDFDAAANAYPIVDVATLSDATNFNIFSESSYDATRRRFERFYEGYSKERTISDTEIYAIFDFIAVRHYELIATITECEEEPSLSKAFLDEQYDWLMRWESVCDKKYKDIEFQSTGHLI